KPKPMIIKIKPADSRYERGTEGGQVTIRDARVTEFAIGTGDGVQITQTIERTGAAELSILGDFPEAKLSRGRAKRKIVVVDEFNRQWLAGLVTFQEAN
ncbi:hypothetical protein CVM52_05715, partial [Pseudooceanicola lipolyticus]